MTDVLDRAKALDVREIDINDNNLIIVDPEYKTILPELVAECERLRKECDARQGFLCQIGDFLKERGRLDGSSAVVYSTQKAICDLEEELVRWQKIAAMAAATASLAIEATDIDWYKIVDAEDIQQAARELGITSGDHFPDATKMMLTAEQRAVLEDAIDWLEVGSYDRDCDCTDGMDSDEIDVLRTMLDQSQPAWEITEERKAAIRWSMEILRWNATQDVGMKAMSLNHNADALKTMLEEAK